MSTRKILHAADIHLDSPLRQLEAYENAPVERIRGASRLAMENMVQLAIEKQVDLVVIAGDLYDGDWPDQNTGLFFVAQATRLINEGIPLVVIRGNHDAANLMTSSLPLPKNPDGSEIMLASDFVDQRRFESLGIVVHGRSFRQRAERENLALDYPAPLRGLFNMGVLHTSLTGAEGHETYAPCTPQQLTDKDYDYWALGHVHTRSEHGLPDGAPINFSGNIQGRHIRETGAKGCLLIDVDERNRCAFAFHETDVVRWVRCDIDATTMQHQDEIMDEFQSRLATITDQAGDRLAVIRVEVTGETAMHDRLHRASQDLKADLQATAITHGGQRVWLEDVRVRTRMPVSRSLVDLDGPIESLVQTIDELRSDPDRTQVIRAELESLIRKLPPEVSEGGHPIDIDDPQWVDELIESAGAEIVGRLQGDEVKS